MAFANCLQKKTAATQRSPRHHTDARPTATSTSKGLNRERFSFLPRFFGVRHLVWSRSVTATTDYSRRSLQAFVVRRENACASQNTGTRAICEKINSRASCVSLHKAPLSRRWWCFLVAMPQRMQNNICSTNTCVYVVTWTGIVRSRPVRMIDFDALIRCSLSHR